MSSATSSHNGFVVPTYLEFLASVIAQCGAPSCLSSADKARIRRAKSTFDVERASLVRALERLAPLDRATPIPREAYADAWSGLCKAKRYSLLVENYAIADGRDPCDSRYPHDARLVPGYARDALGQLRTLTAVSLAHWRKQGLMK